MCKGRVFAMKSEPCSQRVWLPNQDIPGLAMSRAFGDFRLKDHGVIAVPEVFQHRITSKDQFLVLATDGVNAQMIQILIFFFHFKKLNEIAWYLIFVIAGLGYA